MPLNISFEKYLGEVLKRAGYEYRRWRHGILGIRLYVRGPQVVVLIPVIEIPPPGVRPVQDSVEDYFRKLQGILEGMLGGFCNMDLVFCGGGDIVIPDWFLNWCREHGIRVQVLEPEMFNTVVNTLGLADAFRGAAPLR